MSKRVPVAVSSDFTEVAAFLQKRGILPKNIPAEMARIAKAIHEDTHSLILWRFRLRGLKEHGQVFVEEIASDALQILPQVLMGYGKTAKLLIRGIIENTLRHIYFSDHPVEFEWMNRDAKWYITAEELFDYAKKHSALGKTEKKFDAIAKLSSLYSQLSAGVHGRAVKDLEMRIALSKIIYDEDSAKAAASLLRKCTQSSNFLLAVFHQEKMRSFSVEDRRIILRTLPTAARTIWNEHD